MVASLAMGLMWNWLSRMVLLVLAVAYLSSERKTLVGLTQVLLPTTAAAEGAKKAVSAAETTEAGMAARSRAMTMMAAAFCAANDFREMAVAAYIFVLHIRG
jgi:hypothetical protein